MSINLKQTLEDYQDTIIHEKEYNGESLVFREQKEFKLGFKRCQFNNIQFEKTTFDLDGTAIENYDAFENCVFNNCSFKDFSVFNSINGCDFINCKINKFHFSVEDNGTFNYNTINSGNTDSNEIIAMTIQTEKTLQACKFGSAKKITIVSDGMTDCLFQTAIIDELTLHSFQAQENPYTMTHCNLKNTTINSIKRRQGGAIHIQFSNLLGANIQTAQPENIKIKNSIVDDDVRNRFSEVISYGTIEEELGEHDGNIIENQNYERLNLLPQIQDEIPITFNKCSFSSIDFTNVPNTNNIYFTNCVFFYCNNLNFTNTVNCGLYKVLFKDVRVSSNEDEAYIDCFQNCLLLDCFFENCYFGLWIQFLFAQLNQTSFSRCEFVKFCFEGCNLQILLNNTTVTNYLHFQNTRLDLTVNGDILLVNTFFESIHFVRLDIPIEWPINEEHNVFFINCNGNINTQRYNVSDDIDAILDVYRHLGIPLPLNDLDEAVIEDDGPQGLAYEVHNFMRGIDNERLLKIIIHANKGIQVQPGEDLKDVEEQFREYIQANMKGEEKAEYLRYNTAVFRKLNLCESTEEERYLIKNVVAFALSRWDDFGIGYVKSFLYDNYNAYSSRGGDDDISCVGGIKERFVISLNVAAFGLCKGEYKDCYEPYSSIIPIISIREIVNNYILDLIKKWHEGLGDKIDDMTDDEIKEDFVKEMKRMFKELRVEGGYVDERINREIPKMMTWVRM